MANEILGRSIKMQAAQRCDFCGRAIEQGKYGTMVTGDPKEVKAQGLFHGRMCYELALYDYEEKRKKMGMEDEE